MVKSYRCDICDYDANVSSSYKKHLTTKKHLNMIPGTLPIDKCIVIDDNDITIFKCYYCKKTYKNNSYKYIHIKKCKEKHNKLDLEQSKQPEDFNNELVPAQIETHTNVSYIEKILTELKQSNIDMEQIMPILTKLFGNVIQQPDKLIQSNQSNQSNQPIIQIVNNNTTNITNNTNNTKDSNNSNCINFNYIKKHYKNPKTIQECLAPPLTEIEKYNITKATPIVGCEYLIKNRCIVDVELEERPIHSIDESRDKFAVFSENENNTKNWITQSGSDITKKFMPIIREQYENQYNNPLCDPAKIAEGISYMYMDGNRKIVKSIAKMTNLKNNLANNMKNKSDSEVDLENVDSEDIDSEDINSEDIDIADLDYENLNCKYNFIENDSE
jgi:hypothetical protein